LPGTVARSVDLNLQSNSTPAIATYQLTKTYGTNRGIQDVNLHVNRGEIFGFLGPNGAGKSTTLRLLLGFLRPSHGRSEILGLDSQSQTVEVHRRVGNLPSEFNLEDRMTGRDLLTYFARLRGSDPALPHAHVLAERLRADLDRPMRSLSRGNKQKIGIIQALFHRPEVIVLDEPTSGLDPLIQEEFLDILTEAREGGQTIFFSSHILAEIERVADRVGIIRDGKLIATEQPHALTRRSFRYVRIEFSEPPGAGSLAALANTRGIDRIKQDGNTMTCVVRGSFDDVIRFASTGHVVRLDYEPPTLEEILLTYNYSVNE
jgi:ABC-2 type transport system ATP-binding protein